MGHHRIRLEQRRSTLGQPVGCGELCERGDERPASALRLQPKERDDVRLAQCVVKILGDVHVPAVRVAGQQCPRRAQGDARTEFAVAEDLAACDPRVSDVADDQDPESIEDRRAGTL
jgi:hypothetical protein